ncbi:ATP synthase subunit f, mitochondrial [Teratosphaeria destructans]|uniref:ATP synthase subunit f, mitochondrial n=1 Tax=Teratosphaeria destructans TaxID=418781 RepID=A0A9W7SV84_9PEZI|nr:ATP synthase subunit f, mitochondrial [Teratosphaeria destructans]
MVSTIVPPKVASPTAIGGAADAARMKRVVDFYEKLPRGQAPPLQPRGLLQRYQQRYMAKGSGVPLLHLLGGLMLIGYAQNYYFHLRHHKNHAH